MTPCAKCGDAAQVVLGFDYAEQEAWLRDLGADFDRFAEIPLCEFHGDRMTAPRGWTLRDTRSLEPPLFLAVGAA